MTAVGFKNLGKQANEIEQTNKDAITIILMEESGGAQVGLLGDRDERSSSSHKDKDTWYWPFLSIWLPRVFS